MKPPKALIITPVGADERGDLVVNVRLRRRSLYALRLLYRSARVCGLGRIMAARLSVGVVVAPASGTGRSATTEGA